MARIVVLGGGVSGVVATRILDQHLTGDHSVTFVDESQFHEFKPQYLRLLTKENEQDDLTEDLSQLESEVVTFEQSRVEAIQPGENTIETSDGKRDYDFLIVGLGTQLGEDQYPGFVDHAHHVFSARAAKEYRSALENFDGGTLVTGVSSLPYICPAAPVEAALLSEDFLDRRGVRERTDIHFVFPGEKPVAKAGDHVGDMAVEALEEKNITYHSHWKLDEIDPKEQVVRPEDGPDLEYDLLSLSPPHNPSGPVAESSLADDSGWVPVDRKTLRTNTENVYAVGDVAKVNIRNSDTPMPKAGVFARKHAEVAAHQILNQIGVKSTDREFDGIGQCFLVSRNGSWGRASALEANFFHESPPETTVKWPRDSWIWYRGKQFYESHWHEKWFKQGPVSKIKTFFLVLFAWVAGMKL